MNSLSLSIYLIGAIGNLGIMVLVSALFGLGMTVILVCAGLILYDHYEYKEVSPVCFKWAKRAAALGVVSALFIVVVPDRQTVTLIAASQVGEMVLNQDKVKDTLGKAGDLSSDAVDLLRSYIKKQTQEIVDQSQKNG